MQTHEDIKRARRPERPAQVTAKKETVLSPEPVHNFKDHREIIARKHRKANRRREVFLARLAAGAALVLVVTVTVSLVSCSKKKEPVNAPAAETTETPQETTLIIQDETQPDGYYFAYLTENGEPHAVDMEELARSWASEAGFELRYELTDAERYEVAQIVTAEAEGEPLAGKIAICQCILQACEDDGIRPAEAAARYSYSEKRPEPSAEAMQAVRYVFDFGMIASTEPIKYFYNPDLVASKFHESQHYIMTINNHRFYAEKNKEDLIMAVLTQTVTTETAINWEELAQKIKDNTSGLKVGDIITEKTLDGEEMDLVVVDMGPGWARFESKDCLPVEVAYNQNNRNAGGFADSDVKRYLNEEVFNSLPEELRNVIAEVERKQENGESSLCRLFLPTESELFGDCCYSEDGTYSQIEYYKDRRNRIKCNRKGGSPDWYWTASVGSGTSTRCVGVNGGGDSSYWLASNELCVPVCFVIQ